MRQKSDTSTLTLFATRPSMSLCDLTGVILHKNEYSLFYQKFDAEYSLFNNFFKKKTAFSEKTTKNCFGGAFDNFLGKEGVLRQKLT